MVHGSKAIPATNAAPPLHGSTDALLAEALVRAARTLEQLARENGLDCVNEARHLQPEMDAAIRKCAAGATPAPRVETQWPVPKVCWPRLGSVDIALLPGDGKAVWLELKCGRGTNALGPCAWDATKCAFGLAHGYAGAAYLLAGATAADWAKPIRGAEFLSAGDHLTSEMRDSFADWWRYWEKEGYPVAERVPERFATHPSSAASFSVGETWEVRLARVSVPAGVGWIEWPPLLIDAT